MKKVFNSIIHAPDWLIIVSMVSLIIINYIAGFFVKRSIEKVYQKTESVEEAVNKLRIYNQYFLAILQLITIIPLEFLVVKYFVHYGKIGRAVFIFFVPFIFLMIVNVGQLLIINKTYKKIRGTTELLRKQISGIALTFLLILFPIGIIGIISMLTQEIVNSRLLKNIVSAAIPIVVIFLFNLTIPFLYPKLLKAVALEDERLIIILNRLFAKAGIKRAKLYLQPTKEKKIANAMVVGLVKPKVFVSDYYLENAEPSEIEAVIAHEIGHLKQKHVIKRLLYIVVSICVVNLAGPLMEWYEDYLGNEINAILGLVIILALFILYMSVGLLKYYRYQEKKADEFAINIGIRPEIMITALTKLAKLNHTVTNLKKLDEGFQTHPSMAKRIKHIEEISGQNLDM